MNQRALNFLTESQSNDLKNAWQSLDFSSVADQFYLNPGNSTPEATPDAKSFLLPQIGLDLLRSANINDPEEEAIFTIHMASDSSLTPAFVPIFQASFKKDTERNFEIPMSFIPDDTQEIPPIWTMVETLKARLDGLKRRRHRLLEYVTPKTAYLLFSAWIDAKRGELAIDFYYEENQNGDPPNDKRIRYSEYNKDDSLEIIDYLKQNIDSKIWLHLGTSRRVAIFPYPFKPILAVGTNLTEPPYPLPRYYEFASPCPPCGGSGSGS